MDLLYDIIIHQTDAAAIGAIIMIKIIFNVENTVMEFEPLHISVVMGQVEESMRPLLENPPSQTTYLLSNEESQTLKEKVLIGKLTSELQNDEINLNLYWQSQIVFMSALYRGLDEETPSYASLPFKIVWDNENNYWLVLTF